MNGKGVEWYNLKNVDINETIVLVRKEQKYWDCKVLKLVQAGRTFLIYDFFSACEKNLN